MMTTFQEDASLVSETGTMGRIILSAIARYASREAIADDYIRWTYRDLGDHIARAITVLRDQGLKRGDGIAILSSNRNEAVAVEHAAMLMGLRYTALHPLAAKDTHAYVVGDAEVAAVVVDPRVLAYDVTVLRGQASGLRAVLSFGPLDGATDILAAMADATPQPIQDEARPRELVRLLYTGGTTGRPKGVALRHDTMAITTVLQASEWDLPDGAPRFLALTPISHASGAMIPTVLMQGGFVRLTQGFAADRFCKIAEAERISMTFLVPTMIYVLLDYPELATHDLRSLQTIIYGAAPITPQRLKAGLAAFGSAFVQLYGQTECPNCITTLRKVDHDLERPDLLKSCGMPSPLVQIALLDSELNEVAAGQPGEICVRSPLVMQEYWKNPDVTREAFRGGWLHTGDVAIRNKQGYLTIVDRTKDMIISGGFNVYPSEVESALLQHASVSQACVIGVPDEKWGEAVTAYIVLKSGAKGDAEALKALVKAERGAVWSPKAVHFVEAIPLTALGKIDRKALRARAVKT
jgi:fatty-acyl-CoA synthase